MSSGVWKGKSKKNRAIVLVAQEEWKLTWEAKRGQLWTRHVKGHEWNDISDALADDGRRGKIQAEPCRARRRLTRAVTRTLRLTQSCAAARRAAAFPAVVAPLKGAVVAFVRPLRPL